MDPISVLLVDDNPTFLRIATHFLQSQEDVVVVGTASGGEEAVAMARDLRPQVILLDLAMPGLPGLQAIPRLRDTLPEVGIIALTLLDTKGYRQAALLVGADDFVPKVAMNSALLPAIQRVARGNHSSGTPASATPTVRQNGSTDTWRILIMEDEADLRRLYSKALHNAGYEIYPAATIEEARALLKKHRFHVFLCDIHMGNELGTVLLREQAATLAQNGTLVIMVSGEAQYRPLCEEMGADFYLEKPVSISSLVTLVGRLTARQSYYT